METRKTFIGKLIGIGTFSFLPLGLKETRNQKRLKFSYSFESYMTKNFIIPLSDGTVEMNIYGEYYKLIGRAITTNFPISECRVMRFESEMLTLRDLTDRIWNDFDKKCVDYFLNNPTKAGSIRSIPPLIKIV